MERSEYQRYLASREWALKKEAVRARSGGLCERCQRAHHEQTHHVTYERVGAELLEDLLGVCGPCHAFLSAKSDFDPAARRCAWFLAGVNRDWHSAAITSLPGDIIETLIFAGPGGGLDFAAADHLAAIARACGVVAIFRQGATDATVAAHVATAMQLKRPVVILTDEPYLHEALQMPAAWTYEIAERTDDDAIAHLGDIMRGRGWRWQVCPRCPEMSPAPWPRGVHLLSDEASTA